MPANSLHLAELHFCPRCHREFPAGLHDWAQTHCHQSKIFRIAERALISTPHLGSYPSSSRPSSCYGASLPPRLWLPLSTVVGFGEIRSRKLSLLARSKSHQVHRPPAPVGTGFPSLPVSNTLDGCVHRGDEHRRRTKESERVASDAQFAKTQSQALVSGECATQSAALAARIPDLASQPPLKPTQKPVPSNQAAHEGFLVLTRTERPFVRKKSSASCLP
jgi:hypothetical protein